MNRKRLVLAAMIAILLLSLGYAFWAMPRQEKALPRAKTSRPAPVKAAAGKKQPPPAERLNLGLLNGEAQPFPGAARDIFRFRGGSAAPVVTTVPVVAPPPVVVEPPPPPPPPPPPTPEEILRGMVTKLTFLGFLDKGGAKTVFLSEGGEVFIVKAGGAFGKDKSLLAREISDKWLVVGWTQGPETATVELAENEALKPAVMSSAPAASGTGQKAATPAARPAGVGFPPRRILPPRPAIQPVPQPEQQELPEAEVQEESPRQEDVPLGSGQDNVQPPGNGVKLEELLKRRLQGGEGNVPKQ